MPTASYTLCGHHREESSSIFLTPLHQECKDINRIAWVFCSVDWTVPVPSASSQMPNAPGKSLSTCMTLCWTHPKHVHTSCLSGKLRTVLGTPDVPHQCWVEGKDHLPLIYWCCFPWCSAGDCWLTLPQVCLAVSCLSCYSPQNTGLLTSQLPACADAWEFVQAQDFCICVCQAHEFPVGAFLQAVWLAA